MFAASRQHQAVSASHNKRPVYYAAGPMADSSVGISSEADGSFVSFDSEPSAPNILNVSKRADKWRKISEAMLKNDAWGSIRRLLDQVPKEIEEIFDNLEANGAEEKLDKECRKVVYKEFSRMSTTSFGELLGWEVEVLIQSEVVQTALNIRHPDPAILNRHIKEIISKKVAASTDRSSIFDFEKFASTVYEIVRQRKTLMATENRPMTLNRYFPIDPESSVKQGWDIFIMVLLVYCSFEVPYTMAFTNSDDDIIPRTPFEVLPERKGPVECTPR
jgi:hypothetical protein